MTNTSLLEEYIKKSGYKKAFLAEAIGVTRQGFALKCNNKGEFRATEIDTLCKLLNIGVKDRMAIFFAK
jgi:DNA-binding XRE family transcriptional regulator